MVFARQYSQHHLKINWFESVHYTKKLECRVTSTIIEQCVVARCVNHLQTTLLIVHVVSEQNVAARCCSTSFHHVNAQSTETTNQMRVKVAPTVFISTNHGVESIILYRSLCREEKRVVANQLLDDICQLSMFDCHFALMWYEYEYIQIWRAWTKLKLKMFGYPFTLMRYEW